MNLLIFGLCLTGYFVLHSVLADNRIKERLYSIIPIRYYRLMYNLISIIGLVGLLWAFTKIPSDILFIVPSWIGGLIMGIGVVLLFLSLRNYHLGDFLGTHQYAHDGQPPEDSLKTKGLNAWVRHPLYTANFLFFWGLFLYLPTVQTLVFSGIVSLYLIIGTRLEEQKLVAAFGTAYLDYQQKVGRFLPRLW